MSRERLTAKEQAVLDYIADRIAVDGYAPSVRDIGAALGYKSTSTVQMYLDRLLSYGLLCRENGKSRSLRLSRSDARISACPIPLLVGLRRVGERIAPILEGHLLFAWCGGGEDALFALCRDGEVDICRLLEEHEEIGEEPVYISADADGALLQDAAGCEASMRLTALRMAHIRFAGCGTVERKEEG